MILFIIYCTNIHCHEFSELKIYKENIYWQIFPELNFYKEYLFDNTIQIRKKNYWRELKEFELEFDYMEEKHASLMILFIICSTNLHWHEFAELKIYKEIFFDNTKNQKKDVRDYYSWYCLVLIVPIFTGSYFLY